LNFRKLLFFLENIYCGSFMTLIIVRRGADYRRANSEDRRFGCADPNTC